jgi:hypothetical protein
MSYGEIIRNQLFAPFADVDLETRGSVSDGARVHSSLKERVGVKRGFGLRFRGCGGVCRACENGPVAPPFPAQVPCSCERAG